MQFLLTLSQGVRNTNFRDGGGIYVLALLGECEDSRRWATNADL